MTPQEWLCEKAHYVPANDMQILSHEIDGELVGVVGYDNWNGSSCDISWAGSRWTPRFLAAVFYYPFVIGNCKVVIAKVASGNTKSAKAVERLGFTKVVSICDAHPDGYLHVYVLRRENCKLLKRYYHGLS